MRITIGKAVTPGQRRTFGSYWYYPVYRRVARLSGLSNYFDFPRGPLLRMFHSIIEGPFYLPSLLSYHGLRGPA